MCVLVSCYGEVWISYFTRPTFVSLLRWEIHPCKDFEHEFNSCGYMVTSGRLVLLLQDFLEASLFSHCTYSFLPLSSCSCRPAVLLSLKWKNALFITLLSICLRHISTSAYMDSPHLFSELHNISFSGGPLMDLITLYGHFNGFHISAIRKSCLCLITYMELLWGKNHAFVIGTVAACSPKHFLLSYVSTFPASHSTHIPHI